MPAIADIWELVLYKNKRIIIIYLREALMKTNTKAFGEIEIEEDKLIIFENGIVGFSELTKFILLHDEEEGNSVGIHWLQSIQEPGFAMPVMNPLMVAPEYNPEVEDELLKLLGPVNADDLLVLVTVSIPSDLTQISINLQGPIVINATTKKACQIIVDGEQYPVKYPIYEILQSKKAGE